jgi:hypothetical protein
MKINLDKNLVEFKPETLEEKANLEKLWNSVVDCVKFSKKLAPIGEYKPAQSPYARFVIED